MNCRTLKEINNKDWFLVLCIVTRFIAGIGSAMLSVSATSILMKATSYSKNTIVVSIQSTEFFCKNKKAFKDFGIEVVARCMYLFQQTCE